MDGPDLTPTNGPDVTHTASTPLIDTIIQGDCIKTLDESPAGWVDLCFADPPFNIGYRYSNYDDSKATEDYLEFSRRWLRAVRRVLKPTGSFYLAIGDAYAADLCVIARRELGFTLRNWIVWHYTFGQQTRYMFAKSHTHIFYFTMSNQLDAITFNADAVRVASARQTTYNDLRANPKGKLPDDTWVLRPQEVIDGTSKLFSPEGDTWYASRVCGTFSEREGWHGCQMPLAVLERIVRVSSNPGDVVLDPFNGSGTTCVAAAMLGRRYLGIDQSEEYVEHARKRLRELPRVDDASVLFDRDRESRRQSELTALGRPRVPREPGGRRSRRVADAEQTLPGLAIDRAVDGVVEKAS
jgi:site-specific DNA-methyltransferase (adenine-specific)